MSSVDRHGEVYHVKLLQHYIIHTREQWKNHCIEKVYHCHPWCI